MCTIIQLIDWKILTPMIFALKFFYTSNYSLVECYWEVCAKVTQERNSGLNCRCSFFCRSFFEFISNFLKAILLWILSLLKIILVHQIWLFFDNSINYINNLWKLYSIHHIFKWKWFGCMAQLVYRKQNVKIIVII